MGTSPPRWCLAATLLAASATARALDPVGGACQTGSAGDYKAPPPAAMRPCWPCCIKAGSQGFPPPQHKCSLKADRGSKSLPYSLSKLGGNRTPERQSLPKSLPCSLSKLGGNRTPERQSLPKSLPYSLSKLGVKISLPNDARSSSTGQKRPPSVSALGFTSPS